MIQWLLAGVAVVTALALAAFSARRLILMSAALRPGHAIQDGGGELPSVTLLVPCHNEAPTIGATLSALARLEYPAERLFIVLIDDASDDSTGLLLNQWAKARPRTLALNLHRRSGKAAALTAGINAAPASDLVGICDADLSPRPHSLLMLARVFRDETIGAAAPFLSPENARQSVVASYAAVESWVHQLVTSAGKDRLNLNPATNGGSVYRRTALDSIGGFPRVSSGEDIWAAAALTRGGWRIRFVPAAVIGNTVVHRWKDYWHQHLRWSRNLFSTTGAIGVRSELSPGFAMRAELWMQSAGYVDRLAMVAAVGLAGVERLPVWIPTLYAVIIAAQTAVAVAKAGAATTMPRFLFCAFCFYVVDAAASLTSAVLHVLRRPRRWHRAER